MGPKKIQKNKKNGIKTKNKRERKEYMIIIIIAFIVSTLFYAFFLWVGMKLTKIDGSFLAMIIIATISTLFGFIPIVGWIIGTIVMFFLICKWTNANFWPDAVLMVVVARGVGMFVGIALRGLIANM